ncbi:hypothetical protein C8R43DRAFT_940754 [Mycena crocata]|nr:hypothetical protein C8R43DRAFT_940754 [Mycena crocata]
MSSNFKFKLEEVEPAGLQPSNDQPGPSTHVSFNLTPSEEHAVLQDRYRARNTEIQQEKNGLQRLASPPDDQEKKGITASEHRDPQEHLRRKESSERLRASKTFAAFRDYVSEYMMWVTVDEDDPEDVAGYAKFCASHSPALDISDDNLEFLFRHTYAVQVFIFAMSTSSTRSTQLEPHKLEERRRLTRERMARRRAAVKTMSPDAQYEINERARAARAKYRAHQSRVKHTLDEFIRRRRVRESKAAQAAVKNVPDRTEPEEVDELMGSY